MKPLELTGKRFGDLEVLELAGRLKGGTAWRCLCHRCGKETIAIGYRLTNKEFPMTHCGCVKGWRRGEDVPPQPLADRTPRPMVLPDATRIHPEQDFNRRTNTSVFLTGANRTSKTGVRGVFEYPKGSGKYRATVSVCGENWTHGGFATIEEAKAARDAAHAALVSKYGITPYVKMADRSPEEQAAWYAKWHAPLEDD